VLSLELAKKLKDSGLRPEAGNVSFFWIAEVDEIMWVDPIYEPEDDDVWIPRLDQLLNEIEKRYTGSIHIWNPRDDRGKWAISLGGRFKVFFADTLEDAAGKALLWLLERESVQS